MQYVQRRLRLPRIFPLLLLVATIGSHLVTSSSVAIAAGIGTIQIDRLSGNPLIRKIAVFGKDTRTKLPKRYKSLRNSIGQLTMRKGRARYFCSAFCVAPDVIATAAHCIIYPNPSGRRWPLTKIVFQVGRGRQQKFSKIRGRNERAAQWNVIAGATKDTKKPPNTSYDWALAKLASPVCRGAVLETKDLRKWTDLFNAVSEDRVFLAGYHSYKRRVRFRYSSKCLTDDDPKIVRKRWRAYERFTHDAEYYAQHTCDLTQGASGSPLLLHAPDGPAAIGINVVELKYSSVLPMLRKTLRGDARKKSREMAKFIAANSAVTVGAFKKQIELLRNPTEPLPRDQLRLIQEGLRSLGHYKGPLDGLYGAGTRQAILDLERKQIELPTGRPTQQLVALHHFSRGRKAFQGKQFDQAIEYFNQAIKIDPNHEPSYYFRGNVYLNLNLYDKATTDYDKAESLNPRRAGTFNNRGLTYHRKKRLDKAVEDYTQAIRIRPKVPLYYSNRGNVHLLEKRFPLALADYSRAIDINPRYAQAYNNRGNLHRRRKRYAQALKDLDKAIKIDPTYSLAFFNRGRVHLDSGRNKAAITDYSRAIDLNKRFANAYNDRGIALRRTRKYDLAIQDFDQTLKINPKHTNALSNRGLTYRNKGQTDRAIEDFNKALKINPKHANALSNRGAAYSKLGKLDRALSDLDRAITINPKHRHALSARGIVYISKKSYKKAIEDFNQVIELNPQRAVAYNNRAWAHYKLKQTSPGLSDVSESLRFKPDYAPAYDTRGHLFELLGQKEKAIADFRRALQLDPSIKESKAALRRLGQEP